MEYINIIMYVPGNYFIYIFKVQPRILLHLSTKTNVNQGGWRLNFYQTYDMSIFMNCNSAQRQHREKRRMFLENKFKNFKYEKDAILIRACKSQNKWKLFHVASQKGAFMIFAFKCRKARDISMLFLWCFCLSWPHDILERIFCQGI